MNFEYFSKINRYRDSTYPAGLYIKLSFPVFEHPSKDDFPPNKILFSLKDRFDKYIRYTFLEKNMAKNKTRYPLHASMETMISRCDARLLCLEVTFTLWQKENIFRQSLSAY